MTSLAFDICVSVRKNWLDAISTVVVLGVLAGAVGGRESYSFMLVFLLIWAHAMLAKNLSLQLQSLSDPNYGKSENTRTYSTYAFTLLGIIALLMIPVVVADFAFGYGFRAYFEALSTTPGHVPLDRLAIIIAVVTLPLALFGTMLPAYGLNQPFSPRTALIAGIRGFGTIAPQIIILSGLPLAAALAVAVMLPTDRPAWSEVLPLAPWSVAGALCGYAAIATALVIVTRAYYQFYATLTPPPAPSSNAHRSH